MSEETPNFAFKLPDFDVAQWHDDVNNNFTAIDVLLAMAVSTVNQGVWENATLYTVGNRAIDADEFAIFQCLVEHTSAAAGTFAADRAANPTFWTKLAPLLTVRGAWATATDYDVGDFVYSAAELILGRVTVAHTSGATMLADIANYDVLFNFQNLPLLGVGITADASNPFSAKLGSILLTAKYDAEGGDGSLRIKANKEVVADTVSYLFQTGLSSRAEFGLIGNDDVTLKVSPDGAAWNNAIVVDKTTGAVAPKSLRHMASGQPMYNMLPIVGVGAAVELYRIDDTCVKVPRTATISSVAGDVITLTAAVAGQFFSTGMAGFSMVRIWNTSKVPWQPAWVKARPSSSTLQIFSAASISTWVNGEIIQIGDDGSPNASALTNILSVDISPILTSLYGAPFRQAGAELTASIASGLAVGDAIGQTPAGAVGTAITLVRVYSTAASAGFATSNVACTELSPVSDSNLIKLQESFAGSVGIRLVRMTCVFG